jgi:acetylornithine deacetylase/succinyl-diaminopimelate desuccinylase-like protein
MKFPSVKMGPGKSSRSHTADEYIMVSEIEEAIGLYIELLLLVALAVWVIYLLYQLFFLLF